ncbi:MAG: T9SS type A sorting domain-containing protein [Saprospiraceae bacterium]
MHLQWQAAIITIGACSVQSNCINVTVTSLDGEPTAGEAPIQVFPNPNSGLFSLILPEAATVLLFNAAGSNLWQNQFQAGRHEINQQVLPSGIYLLHAIRSTKVETVRIMAE